MTNATRNKTSVVDGQVAGMHRDFVAGRKNVVDVCEEILDAIKIDQLGLNAFCHLNATTTLAMAKASEARYRNGAPLGQLDGIPVSIKDTIAVAGWPTRRGSLTTPATPAENDAISVRRLRDAGAVLLGKTTTPEHAWKGTTESPISGITRNPLDTSLTPGGSSGGAAAATAAGMGIIGVGSDAAGSVRIPAAFTGLVGYKPSFGLIPLAPYPEGFLQLAHLGVMTPTVADAVISVTAMAGAHSSDWTSIWPSRSALDKTSEGPLRIGILSGPSMDALSPEVEIIWRQFVEKIQGKDIILETVEVDLSKGAEIASRLYRAAVAQNMKTLSEEALAMLEPELREFVSPVASWSASDILENMTARERFTGTIRRLLQNFDVLLSPTMPDMPPAADPAKRTTLDRDWLDWNPYTPVANLTHLPAFSIPWYDRSPNCQALPIGIQILAAPGCDSTAAHAALMIENLAVNIA